MEVFLTVISGVVVFVVGQIIVVTLIEPLRAFRELRGRITWALFYYGNASYSRLVDLGNQEHLTAAHDELRSLSGQLWERSLALPSSRVARFLLRLPSRDDVRIAARSLAGLSHYHEAGSYDREPDRQAVRDALRLPSPHELTPSRSVFRRRRRKS